MYVLLCPLIHRGYIPRPSVNAWDRRCYQILYVLCSFLYIHKLFTEKKQFTVSFLACLNCQHHYSYTFK